MVYAGQLALCSCLIHWTATECPSRLTKIGGQIVNTEE